MQENNKELPHPQQTHLAFFRDFLEISFWLLEFFSTRTPWQSENNSYVYAFWKNTMAFFIFSCILAKNVRSTLRMRVGSVPSSSTIKPSSKANSWPLANFEDFFHSQIRKQATSMQRSHRTVK